MDTLSPNVPGAPALLDCDAQGTRAVNQALRALEPGATARVAAPRGRHNLAVGLHRPISVRVGGNAATSSGVSVAVATAVVRTSPWMDSWAGRSARTSWVGQSG